MKHLKVSPAPTYVNAFAPDPAWGGDQRVGSLPSCTLCATSSVKANKPVVGNPNAHRPSKSIQL